MARVNNTEFYNASLKKYQDRAKQVHWQSVSRQHKRFHVMQKVLGDNIKEVTLVDAGCGLGDFYTYLLLHKSVPLKYTGIDNHSQMVHLAKQETKQEILYADILKDMLPQADYYLCSGALNTLEPFETILFIKKMLLVSVKGVIFNILKGDNKEGMYNKYTVKEMQNLLSFFKGSVEIIEDYLEDDFTVFLRKEL